MRSTLLAACCAALSLSVSAQQINVSFDDSLPANWRATGSSLLSLNTEHLKGGSHALKWDAVGGDTLIASSLAIGTGISSSSHFFIYSPAAGQDTLVVQFLDNSNLVKREGHVLLNFKGWREYHRNLQDDYNYGNSLPAFYLDGFRIIYRPGVPGASGRVWLDQMQFVGYGQARTPGPHMALDHQHFAINPEDGPAGNGIESWLLAPDIPDTSASASDLSRLATVRIAYNRALPVVDSADLSAAKSFVTSCAITRNPDSSITGKPLSGITIYTPDTLTLLSNYCGFLASAFYYNADTDAHDKLLLFTEYLLDQGLAEGGRTVLLTNDYKYTDSFPQGFLRALPFYPSAMRQDIIRMLKFSNEYNKIYATAITPGLNLDYLYLKAPFLYELACADTSNNNGSVRDLKCLSRWLGFNTLASQGGRDGIKPDGTAFHHQAHQLAYTHAYNTWINCAASVKGTNFRITQTAYTNFAAAVRALFLESSKGAIISNAECGRSPFPSPFPVDSATFGKLIGIGGDLQGASSDPAMAAVYNYIYGASGYGAGVANMDGFYAFNYAQLGVFRKSGWTAAMRGFTDRLFGSEIYPTENRYGRYQSYGAVEILYSGLTATGYRKDGDGWDWNLPPGATTVRLSNPNLIALQPKQEEHQLGSFAGALPLGKDGVFGMDFRQDTISANYASSQLHFRKSVFALDTLMICLGSGIGVSTNYGQVSTTLFQASMDPAVTNPPIYIDTSIAQSTSYSNSLKVDSPGHWLLNGQGTGFYVPGGNDSLNIFRGSQSTPAQSDTNGTVSRTSNASKAWISHGNTPSASRYEFVIVPKTTTDKMVSLASALAKRSVYTVLSQTDTLHALRYLPSHLDAYVFFQPKSNVNIGFIKNISAKALLGARETGDTLTLTIANPDLNAVDDSISYWHSTPSSVSLTVKGTWTVLENASGAGITQVGDSLVAAFSLTDGFPATLKLVKPGANPSLPGVWTYQYPVDSSWVYNIDTGKLHTDTLVGAKVSLCPGTGSTDGFLATPPSGTLRLSNTGGAPRMDLIGSPRKLRITASSTTATDKFSAYGFAHATPVASAFFTIGFNDSTTNSAEWSFAIGKNSLSGFFNSNSGLPTNNTAVADIFGAMKWVIAPASPSVINLQVRERVTNVITGAVSTSFSSQSTTFFHRDSSYAMEIYANASSRQQTYLRGITTYTVLPRTYHVWANNIQMSYNGNAGFPADEMPADSLIYAFSLDGKNSGSLIGALQTADNSARLTLSHLLQVNYAQPNPAGGAAWAAKAITINPAVLGSTDRPGIIARLIPNPAVDQVQLLYTAPVSGKTSISIISMSGLVCKRQEVWIASGTNYIPLSTRGLASGLYTVVVTGINGRQQIRLLKK